MNDEIIFVVDDNRQINDFWTSKILPSLGYKTLSAYDGKTALDIIKNNEISLMLLDLQLPDMSGLDILRHLSSEGRFIPSILITANGSEHIAAEAFRLGVEDYLSKPVDADQLSEAITRALTESRLRREKAILTAHLKRQLSWQSVLTKIGQSVTSSLKHDQVLRRIVEAAIHITHAEEGFLALLDEESGQLYLRAAKNMDREKSQTMRLPVSDNLIAQVFKTGKPVRTTTQSDEGPLIKVVTGFLVHSLLHVPIQSKGKTLGVLSVVNHTSQRSFKEKDEVLLISLADYAAVAIENANLYSKAQDEIAERRRIEENLRDSEERYALAVRGANDGIWDWDFKTETIYYSPRWKSILGYVEEEVNDSPDEWFSKVHPEDLESLKLDISAHLGGITAHFENEQRMLHKDGTYRWILSRGLAVLNDNGVATRLAGSQTDVTDRKYAEQKLLHDAFYDKLTNLPNRALFLDHLRLAVERAKRRPDHKFAVLFLDVDRFKDVNDSYGHMVGDKLLVEFGQLLATRLRTTDTIARFGGDEFVILIDDITDESNATQIAEWIDSELVKPFQIKEHEIFVTVSIGIVLSEIGYERAEDILRDADIAMYDAKGNGRARYEMFEPAMRVRIVERLEIENDLRRAIENNEFRVYYQVIGALDTHQVAGFEALVRWQHPERGLVSPDKFIPIAEETGMIIPIDRWVMREACRQMHDWQTKFPTYDSMTISVNLSSKHIAQPDLVEYIEETLSETGLNGDFLKLEITESALLENNDYTIQVFNQLQELGIQIQIDDFGKGYSSLSYLSNFPIDALKIDRSFVSTLPDEGNNLQILQAMVNLSQRLGVGVIAEGVETEYQLAQLKLLGCEYGQGYLLSMPLESKEVVKLLKETKLTGALPSLDKTGPLITTSTEKQVFPSSYKASIH
ncbi:MAG: EAL domain-containing protein [Anaerolineales bacterium]|nr:EAL domain-containing protein [Anaerolineales bacterium]